MKKLFIVCGVCLLLLFLLPYGVSYYQERLILNELEKAVYKAERKAVADARSRTECTEAEATWRAPIKSLKQEVRVQLCNTVYYYMAGYSPVGGYTTFHGSMQFLAEENLLTGKFKYP